LSGGVGRERKSDAPLDPQGERDQGVSTRKGLRAFGAAHDSAQRHGGIVNRFPLLTRGDVSVLEILLAPHYREEDGSLVETLRRLLQSRTLEQYDRATVTHAREESKSLRVALAAACLSQPNRQLRISRRAQAALQGPERIELQSSEDMATNEIVFSVREG
jgi:hypothetical protein